MKNPIFARDTKPNSNKTINFFIKLFCSRSRNKESIKNFVKSEYRENDRNWAYNKIKSTMFANGNVIK